MADQTEHVSGAEEYVATEIELAKPFDPEAEKTLRATLEKTDAAAFDSCDIAPDKISLCYDPTRTNQKLLLDAIKEAGGKLKHVESGASPLL